MKYVKEAILKSGALRLTIIDVIISAISMVINARILVWLSDAIENYYDPINPLWKLIGGIVAMIGLTIITSWTRAMGTHYMFTYLNNMLSEKLLNADYEMFTKFSPGNLVTTSGSLWNISGILRTGLSMVKNLLQFIVTVVAIMAIKKEMLLPIVIIYGTGAIVIYKLIKIWIKIDNKVDDIKRERNKEIDEIINGFAEVRSFENAGKNHLEHIKSKNFSIVDLMKSRAKNGMITNTFIQIVDGLITIIVVFYAIIGLNTGAMTATATAVTLVVYAWRLIDPLVMLIENISSISELKAPIPKFVEVMNYTNKVHEGDIDLESFDREIKFDNVYFSYDKSSYILQNVNFTIQKGEHVGICGATGGGKSTLLKLIPKFYDVSGGTIFIDGVDIDYLTKESIRKHIGIVHQDPYIFDDTIMGNIKYACQGMRTVSDMEVYEACKRASIYDFVMSLPETFDTKVGPRGLKLSGGQKQRIALARLFLSDPEIIILDEATSALDNDTERFVQDSLNAFKNKTMIVVAHRLSTIKDSDKIIVIDKHKVVEEGTHDELLSQNGIYASMYNA